MAGGYPIVLKVEGRRCVVVGGGQVALRKVHTLLEAGARVTVVAPELVEELQELARAGVVEHIAREAEPGDVRGAFVVIAASDDARVNAAVAEAAAAAGVLVNVVDCPELCNFFVPATLRRGPVTVAVGTGGHSPMLARRLREKLEGVVGPEYGELAELLGRLRKELMRLCPDQRGRAKVWAAIVDSEVIELLREGRRQEAERLARSLFSVAGAQQEEGERCTRARDCGG